MPEDVIANIMRMREAEYMKLISAESIEAMVSAYINDIADLGGNNFDKEEFYTRVRSFVKEVQEWYYSYNLRAAVDIENICTYNKFLTYPHRY